MARDRPFLFSLNGGQVSPLALARVDLQRMKLTAERFENCIPKIIGPLQFRGGLGYQGVTDGEARNIPFIFSVDDTALVELSNLSMRVVIDRTPITRAAVSSSITNGNFSSGTGWTLTTAGGGVANINSTTAGALTLQTPVRGGSALAKRSFTISAPDQNIEHAIHVVVTRGTVRFRLGSTDGGTEYLGEIELGAGTHSLVFTPTSGTAWVQFSAQSETYVIVDSVQIEGSGIFELATPWPTAELFNVRYDQSGDVIFGANDNYAPQRLERRGARSWSVVPFQFKDGPWRRKTANVTLTPSVRLGNGTLTSSAAFFTALHVGSLFELTHTQTVASVSLAGNDVYTDTVRVAGANLGTVRNVTYAITGTWVGTVTVQESFDEGETWQNRTAHASNAGGTYNPGTDNTVVFVRLGFQAGEYTSGTAVIALSTPGGGGTGVVRVTGYNSATSVNIEVVKRLHYTGATENWRTSKYDNVWGWPSSVVLYDGRLWFGGADQLAGSYSDDFTNFNVDEEGDSAPIIRSIASGPVNKVQWMLGLARLIIGTSGGEAVPRSSSFDEPMTASNISIKDASTYGSADVAAIKIDRSGIFAGRSGKKAYEISYDIEANDYSTVEITRYNPTILNGVVKVMAVQRQPDTRIWFVLEDGTAVLVVRDRGEDVLAWCTFITDGDIEDVAVIPNTDADDVYMIVNRTINGSPVRYRERLAYDNEAEGGTDNYMADSYVVRDLVATDIVGTLSHLEGETDIVAWVNGAPLLGTADATTGIRDPLTFTVTAAAITLPSVVTGRVIVGKYYEGFWKSTKLAYAAQTGTAMSQKKIVDSAAPILYNTHAWATLWGQDFDKMLPVPPIVRGADVSDTLLATYDYDAFALSGNWDNDSRLCMKARAPMPATVLGVGLGIQSHER